MRLGAHFDWLGSVPIDELDMSKSAQNVFEQRRFPPHRAGALLPN
jgi:hypothetical protein